MKTCCHLLVAGLGSLGPVSAPYICFGRAVAQVVYQKALQSASLREIKEDLKVLFLIRYEGSGFKLPRVIYTDMCCEDRALLVEIFRELEADGLKVMVEDSAIVGPALRPLELPSADPTYLKGNTDSDALKAICDRLRRQAAAHGGGVGLDIEWEVSMSGAPENPPATIQLAAGDCVVVLHMLHGQKTAPKKIPQSVVDILEDESIIKCGVSVSGDAKRLKRHFDVDVKKTVELVSYAKACKVEFGLKRGLADLCSNLLGRHLSKEQFLRLSKWNTRSLSHEQLRYVTLQTKYGSWSNSWHVREPFLAMRSSILRRPFVIDVGIQKVKLIVHLVFSSLIKTGRCQSST